MRSHCTDTFPVLNNQLTLPYPPGALSSRPSLLLFFSFLPPPPLPPPPPLRSSVALRNPFGADKVLVVARWSTVVLTQSCGRAAGKDTVKKWSVFCLWTREI